VVIDKTRNIAGVLMTCYMNSIKVRDEITYSLTYGDKESYWISHALTSTPYHFVFGYAGGIGHITHTPDGDNDNEHICTLQLLHVLESTSQPLWLNNAITEYKGADDAQYLVPDGWVPHNGRWQGGGRRFPNELCVRMPETDRDVLLGLTDKVNRVEGEMKFLWGRMIEEVTLLDGVMEEAKLVEIHR
jgi:Mannosyltransferase putative